MKRNMDLIRDLLLHVEALPAGVISHEVTWDDEKYNEPQVLGHLKLLIDSDYIDGQIHLDHGGGCLILLRGLTMEGHDFLDVIRDDSIWLETKEKIAGVGGSVAMNVVKATATAILVKMLGL